MGTEFDGDFSKVPEACISHVLSLTSPRDSCRSAAVSASFRSAVDSDTVWERFLPEDYEEILDRAAETVEFGSKRDLYFRLCDPILVDGGKMSFHLEKSSGAKCYMISARELGIVWGDTPHYWKWISAADTRFAEVAYLLNVCWLEIHGKVETRILSPKTNYVAYLVFKLDPYSRGLSFPVQESSVKFGAYESKHCVCVQPNRAPRRRVRRMPRPFARRAVVWGPEGEGSSEDLRESRVPSSRSDGWMEIEMGEFFNDGGDDGEVDFRFLEVKGGNWKSGLTVLGIEVRPKK
ncbi:uncharacterized protein A4U43_C07F19690 [Asparagus officinalis]|uniref:F-box domain-containing protein n=1 Tax=Asparagus officinalis TaxID=4686 RepID=A0A5P1EGP2_ASPOF|nr:F-box protein PP2-B10-like isoform X2 [Asparagus officinalis]ONK63861.1 uncharacterized protein A4U43_C07F19690 [Asparagus officinalis]